MTTADTTTELPVPRRTRELVGAIIATFLLLGFVGSSSWLATYNLLHLQAIIPSALWLGAVGFFTIAGCMTEGTGRFAIDILGAFSLQQFVRIDSDAGQLQVQFGFRLFGRRFYYVKVPLQRIHHICWNTGQASYHAKRELDDWHVVVWYDCGDPQRAEREKGGGWRHPGLDLHIVGSAGPKEPVAAFGHTLIDFLQKFGVTFVPGENDCTFVRERSSVG